MSRIRPVTARPVTYRLISSHNFALLRDLCKNVSLAVLFGSNSNSCTFSTQSDMYIYIYIYTYIYTHIYSSQYRDADWAEELKILDSGECRMPFWARATGSLTLD